MVKPKFNPHCWMSRLGKPPVDNWKCNYCGLRGTMDTMHIIECTYVYPPCEFCGQTPECSLECLGIAVALTKVMN